MTLFSAHARPPVRLSSFFSPHPLPPILYAISHQSTVTVFLKHYTGIEDGRSRRSTPCTRGNPPPKLDGAESDALAKRNPVL